MAPVTLTSDSFEPNDDFDPADVICLANGKRFPGRIWLDLPSDVQRAFRAMDSEEIRQQWL